MLKISSRFRTILCFTGGIIFIAGGSYWIVIKPEDFHIGSIIYSYEFFEPYIITEIVIGVITIICALLKYPKTGSSLCLFIGVGSLFFSSLLIKLAFYATHLIYGSILIISGSSIGVLGVLYPELIKLVYSY